MLPASASGPRLPARRAAAASSTNAMPERVSVSAAGVLFEGDAALEAGTKAPPPPPPAHNAFQDPWVDRRARV